MSGAFGLYQPLYAAHGIATFPVRDKKPAIKDYLKIGAKGSEQLALKFSNENTFGFACRRSQITVLDVDTPDERVLADALDRHGPTPFVVRSGSGNWQAWYRHNGEPRRTRVDQKPIDILGDGFVVAPPSQGSKGLYQIVEGSLDDLDHLPVMRGLAAPAKPVRDVLPEGRRDDGLFRQLLREARNVDDFDSLLDIARTINMEMCFPPLGDEKVVEKAKSAWRYEVNGKNWAGRKARASTDRDEILAFSRDPHAALLLNLLRVSHPDPDLPFAIDQVKTSELLSWSRPTLNARIRFLIEYGKLRRIHHGRGKGDPHLYVLRA